MILALKGLGTEEVDVEWAEVMRRGEKESAHKKLAVLGKFGAEVYGEFGEACQTFSFICPSLQTAHRLPTIRDQGIYFICKTYAHKRRSRRTSSTS